MKFLFRDSELGFQQAGGKILTPWGKDSQPGATPEQDLSFSMAIGAAYLQEGVYAGLPVDSFAPRFTFNTFGGSMEFFKEVFGEYRPAAI